MSTINVNYVCSMSALFLNCSIRSIHTAVNSFYKLSAMAEICFEIYAPAAPNNEYIDCTLSVRR